MLPVGGRVGVRAPARGAARPHHQRDLRFPILTSSQIDQFDRELVRNHFSLNRPLPLGRRTDVMSDDDQASLPVPVSVGQIIPSKSGAIYLELDQLLGTLRRKNHSVLDKAFALSKNRLAQNIIWRLSEHGSLTAKELSLKTGSSPSTVSSVVTDLVRLGVIVKQSGPRGTEPLSISDACKLQITQHIDYVKYLLEDSFCVLDTDELSKFTDYIKRITSRLEKIEEILAD